MVVFSNIWHFYVVNPHIKKNTGLKMKVTTAVAIISTTPPPTKTYPITTTVAVSGTRGKSWVRMVSGFAGHWWEIHTYEI